MLGVDHDKIILLLDIRIILTNLPFPTIKMLGKNCCCNVILFYVGNNQCSIVLYCIVGGFAMKKIPKILGYYGSGWMGPGLTRNFVCCKIVQNIPKSVHIFWSSRPYTISILSVYTLLKVVGYYDLSVLSMPVIGLKKKKWMCGGWV